MRLVIIAADVLLIYYGRKLMRLFGIAEKGIWIFSLNPLVIIELTGNLHFEGIALCFFIMALYYLKKQKHYLSGMLGALSIGVKLVPVIWFPLILFMQKFKKAFLFYIFCGIVLLMLFLPFMRPYFFPHFFRSLKLYTTCFEFNAGLFYILRTIGWHYKGYDMIHTIGPLLDMLAFASMILIYVLFALRNKKEQFFNFCLLLVCTYYFYATTVHPWYVIYPLVLCCFTRFRFPVLWSLLVILSYYAYSHTPVKESNVLIAVEYLSVIGFALWEIMIKPKVSTKHLA